MAEEVRVAHILVDHFRQISLLDQHQSDTVSESSQATSQQDSMPLEIELRGPEIAVGRRGRLPVSFHDSGRGSSGRCNDCQTNLDISLWL
jgi:hypothetical protein